MIYVTDSLYYRDRGQTHKKRWCDMVMPREIEYRDPNEVIGYLVDKAGLVVE